MIRLAPLLLRLISRLLFVFVAMVALYLLAALIGGIIPGSFKQQNEQGASIEPAVYLVSNLLHSDLAIPLTPEVKEKFGFLQKDGIPIDNEAVKYLVIGWGAHDFYTSTKDYSDLKFSTAFKAITGDSAVIHIQPAVDVSNLPGFRKTPMEGAEFTRLLDYIANSFIEPGRLPPLYKARFSNSDAFYLAKGRFNIFNPCNQWVNRGLQEAGLGSGAWTPTAYSLEIARWLYR